jgi:hypothetical protein
LESRGFRRVFLAARFAAVGGLKVATVVPIRESLMAKCPNTRLTIPECSCARCLEEQIRNAAPALLEKKSTPSATDAAAAPARRTPARA